MPVYEYRCDQCGKTFEVTQSLDEHTRAGPPACPICKSAGRVQPQLSSFTPVTSRKS